MKLSEAKERRNAVEHELTQIHEQMKQLVQEFKAHWRKPWVVHPGVWKGAKEERAVRWRLRGYDGIGQSWLRFASQEVQSVLDYYRVPASTRLAWLDIDRRGQALTLRYRVLNMERARLVTYIHEIHDLNAIEDRLRQSQS
ncbi:hypothetical protein [Thioalkalivibrio sp. ALE20]|uniref:hypothetical protein n=1 Tax=Thioalkalivibrio sp. ALE20 TaxID=545275 RepID=UPI000373FD43|nr:hypothetical protein [Thioalkalivibrio sp. ALE20]